MPIHIVRCGDAPLPQDLPLPVHTIPTCPGRKDLHFIDELVARYLPHDPTPSLDEIAAQPDVDHLGAPGPDPRTPIDTVRLVVVGTDADLDAVATRLMRIDATWIELAYVPVLAKVYASSGSRVSPGESSVEAPSGIATSWGVADKPWSIALSGSVRPVPLIRDDSGRVTLGVAEICSTDGSPFVGEIIIDDTTVGAPDGSDFYGTRLISTLAAPGIAAVAMTGPSVYSGDRTHPTRSGSPHKRNGLLGRFFHRGPEAGAVDSAVLTGRAVQAGGEPFMVYRDGVAHPRPLTRVTFYRHLRDMQVVRP
ncbi:hypothetical protein I6J22_08365 [Corynebacterium kroppenstedtii]|uniref:Uncharacterized protein n=1 Tax=Corynebacterium kroppenstedtii (strain DSM 44385 / JCM 11950 / CIP 105744 / CCUG 35717) TaxID=645127 RepID=C4LKV1_CORK4|nr:hypothetical protein [Corynebacterium kroppenstedtii]ACR18456.1 conserved hypothetical protein [Corynebacterium kroppenstedtii DSM 44385]QRP10211.1 hypothetical protein I6J22_08365 [Corynebacterium kroppenstedtii]HJD68434.1 hypothetical protein [Corynebacterium kroppenstedtii]